MTKLSECQYALKAAVRRAVILAGGPAAACKALRVDAARLSRYGNPEDPSFIPVDVAHELDKLAGETVILRAMADLFGFELVPRNMVGPEFVDLTQKAGEFARESGELVSTVIEAGHDEHMSPNEARRIDDAAADVEAKVIQIRQATRRVMRST